MRSRGQLDQTWARIRQFVVHAVGQVRLARDPYGGLMHFLIFWGFMVQAIGTVIALTQQPLFVPFLFLPLPRGETYLAYELVMDLAGVALVAGTVMAIYRRYAMRPEQLDNRWDDAYALSLLLALPLVGFALEGLRILAAPPPWAAWSPVGNGVAGLLAVAGVTPAAASAAHSVAWWSHVFVACLFVASIPFTKLSHLVTGPLNILLRPLLADGALAPIENIEQAEVLGVGKLEEFSPGQLLELDACVRCGRCESVCAGYLSGAPFSPKRFIQDLRAHMMTAWLPPDGASTAGGSEPMIGGAVPESDLWVCCTCGACLQECPMFVAPMRRVMDLRRYLSLSVGKLPATVSETYRNLANRGNPWGIAAGERTRWAEGLEIRQLAEGQEVDILYYLGCCFAYEARHHKAARSMVRLMQEAGVDFGIIGESEVCCGETARRLGEEYLYQTLAAENIQNLSKYKFNRILTQCAHCFNTLKNEYPQFGGEFEVIHHTQLLAELLEEGRLRPARELDGRKVTFHDPCYLGRYNGVYDPPRQILASIPGLRLAEMERTRARSFCCGGGGGQMWLESPIETRISLRRLDQAAAVEPDIIGTACPYCLLMLEDAVKVRGMEGQIEVADLVELMSSAPDPVAEQSDGTRRAESVLSGAGEG